MKEKKAISSLEESATNSTVDNVYTVEAVRNKRFQNGSLEYLIKWQGFPEEENTWEGIKNLEGCQYLVNQYENQLAVEKASIYQNDTVIAGSAKERNAKRSRDSKMGLDSLSGIRRHNNMLSNVDKKVKADKIIGATDKNGSIVQKKSELAKEKASVSQNDTVIPSSSNAKERHTKKCRDSKMVSDGPAITAKIGRKCQELKIDQDSVANMTLQKTGFDKGLKAEKIIGSTNKNGCIEFLVKFRGNREAEFIPSEIVKNKIPQQVIKYYEDRIEWCV